VLTDSVLRQVDDYLHTVPLSDVDRLEVGGFTLFRSHRPWPYYARPRPDRGRALTAADVELLRERCHELDLPLNVEWVTETAPELAELLDTAGLDVVRHPLLVVTEAEFRPAADGVDVRLVPAERDALLRARAVADVAFGHPAGGTAGPAEREEAMRHARPDMGDALLAKAQDRQVATMAAFAAEFDPEGPVAHGQYRPIGEVAEIVGVGTLPVARRRGFGTAVASALTAHALAAGVRLVTLSAADERVAQMYRTLGYRIIGEVGAAE
jgi:GNAT superfamily N-acetyltransferase